MPMQGRSRIESGPSLFGKDFLVEDLYRLADLYGIQTSYYEVSGKHVHASPDALTRVLQAIGAGVHGAGDAPEALRRRRQFLAERWIEPVNVLWDSQASEIPVQVPAEPSNVPAKCTLTLENGERS